MPLMKPNLTHQILDRGPPSSFLMSLLFPEDNDGDHGDIGTRTERSESLLNSICNTFAQDYICFDHEPPEACSLLRSIMKSHNLI